MNTFELDIKEGDVFRYKFNQEYLDNYPLDNPYHCFDGQLIVRKLDNKLIFEDTYWSTPKRFELDWLNKNGSLTFICNLNEVVKCSESDLRYYDNNDIINLSYQHGCYRRFVRKLGSKRSKTVMSNYIKFSIEEKERTLKYINEEIKRLKELEIQICKTDVDLDKIYIPIL